MKTEPKTELFRARLEFAVPSQEEQAEFAAKSKDPTADEKAPWINPADMTEGERAEMLAKIEAREVTALRFWAVVIGTAGNLNRVDFSPKNMKELATSADGSQNLLNGHGSYFGGSPADPIVGQVLMGKTDKREGTGEVVAMLGHRLADEYSMKQFVRYLWRNFSISAAADSWEYIYLDKNGKEIEKDEYGEPRRWRDVVDYRVRPVGPVKLRHNAFVADPAYLGTAIIKPFSTGKAKEFSMGDDAQFEAMRAQLAKLQADKDAADLRFQESEMKRFEAGWALAAAKGQVLPAEFEAQKKIAASKDFGVDFALAQINARPVAVAFNPAGAPPAVTPPSANPNPAAGGVGLGLTSMVGGTEIIFGAANKEQQDEMLAEVYPNGLAAKRVALRRAQNGGR